jgi:hypothetical protein
MSRAAINLADKFSKFSEHWSPKIVARMNDYEFKLVKLQGDFVWHRHADTDEVFIVVEHKPSAAAECRVMLVETAGTVNTGDAASDRTAPVDAAV